MVGKITVGWIILQLLLNVSVMAQHKTQELVMFPGTSISIVPPKHFELTDLYQGFLHKPTNTSLVASKAENQNSIAFNKGLTTDYFNSQGLVLIKSETVKTPDWEGVIYYTSFRVKEVDMQRMMLVMGDYNDTYIIMANFPAMFASQLTVPIRESFLSVKFN
ncbi:MAG TPA: hypothetical protein VIK89_03630 [Cytophagaceae bacterium]